MLSLAKVRLPGVVALSFLVFSACQDEVVRPDQGALPEEIASLPPGIHPIVSIPGLETAVVGSSITLRVHLHSVDIEDEVASYQGVFVYEPDVLEIQTGSFPDGILGAWNQIEPGRIRFAGAVLEGIGTRPILELRGRLKRMPAKDDFFVQIEEVVAAEKLVVMTNDVVLADAAPILTSANLELQVR